METLKHMKWSATPQFPEQGDTYARPFDGWYGKVAAGNAVPDLNLTPIDYTGCSGYVGMLDSADDDRIDKVLKMRQSSVEKYGNAPEVIVVDATQKPSASEL